jgi:WD40 repeat protein
LLTPTFSQASEANITFAHNIDNTAGTWLAFSPDGSVLACASKEGISVYDTRTRRLLNKIPITDSTAIALANDGRLIAVARSSWNVIIVDLAGVEVTSFNVPKDNDEQFVDSLVFSNDKQSLFVSIGFHVLEFDIKKKKSLRSVAGFSPIATQGGDVLSVQFSKQGITLRNVR